MLISGNLKLNSLDYVLIVDRDYNIIFNTRYESKVNSTAKDFSKDEYLKKKSF
jgi:arginine utilization regulatory protein